jgi:hypothetical protein
MKNPTLKSFIAGTNIPETLIRSTIRQLGGWTDYTQQNMLDICRGGGDAGWHGFIYYTETTAFTRRNKKLILDLLSSQAADYGYAGPTELIASFRCLKNEVSNEEVWRAIYTGKGEMLTTIYNALAWYALEEVSRAYSDYQEYQK